MQGTTRQTAMTDRRDPPRRQWRGHVRLRAAALLGAVAWQAGVLGASDQAADHFRPKPERERTTRVSVASEGTQGDSGSTTPAVSTNGRVVAFMSLASTLVADDTNAAVDIFVHDRRTGATERVSVATDGTQADDDSLNFALSADGRVVVFTSEASTLVPGDTNGVPDIFVHDRRTGETSRVSVATDGTEGNGPSNLSVPGLSAHGRVIVFTSAASTLVPDDTNGRADVFVHDRRDGTTTRVSVATDGTQGNDNSHVGVPSANGQVICFESDATNLVAGDTNGFGDVFVHDRRTGETTRVSVADDGTQGNSGSGGINLSADGRAVVFVSSATTLVAGDRNGAYDVFVHDRRTRKTTRVSVATDGREGNGDSNWSFPEVSWDGRVVVFGSAASTLVAGDTNGAVDVFVHDRRRHETTRASVATDGTEGNGSSGLSSASFRRALSASGRFVAFVSAASTLVANDTNGVTDVFVRDRWRGTTSRVSVASDGAQGNADSFGPDVSPTGRVVAFWSRAGNLVMDDTNGTDDIFVRTRRYLKR